MFRQYRELEQGEHIVVGCDTAAGGGDWCAAQFFSKTHLDVPIVYHSDTLATNMTEALFHKLEEVFDITRVQPTVAFERQNGGVFEMERLATLNRNGKYIIFRVPGSEQSSEPRLGWDTNSATRPAMLQQLKEAIDGRAIRVYDQLTIEELFSFVIVKTTSSWKAQAEVGAHDDLVMSLAIAFQLHQYVAMKSLRRVNEVRREYDATTGRLIS